MYIVVWRLSHLEPKSAFGLELVELDQNQISEKMLLLFNVTYIIKVTVAAKKVVECHKYR